MEVHWCSTWKISIISHCWRYPPGKSSSLILLIIDMTGVIFLYTKGNVSLCHNPQGLVMQPWWLEPFVPFYSLAIRHIWNLPALNITLICMEHEGDEAWNAIDTPPPKKKPKKGGWKWVEMTNGVICTFQIGFLVFIAGSWTFSVLWPGFCELGWKECCNE